MIIASLNRKHNQLVVVEKDGEIGNVICAYNNITGLKREANLEEHKGENFKNAAHLPSKWYSIMQHGKAVGWLFGIEIITELW